MWYTYIIKSINYNYRYIGSTSDIVKRLDYHNKGSNKSTKPYKPFKIIYLEKANSKQAALIRERQLKSYKGGEALKKLIKSWGTQVDNEVGL